MKKNLTLNILRISSLAVGTIGALGSLCFTIHAGRNNKSVLLVLLFVIWVLSPFAALVVANVVSKRWSIFARKSLYSLMLILTVLSLVCYSGVLSPAGTKTAFVFLVVPLISWLLIAIFILIARSLSQKSKRI